MCALRWLTDAPLLADVPRSLPASFDVEFLLAGFERIVDADHHQAVNALLVLLYKHGDLFVGRLRRQVCARAARRASVAVNRARAQLCAQFLLRRCFYQLFLHWDETVRATFYQVRRLAVGRQSL